MGRSLSRSRALTGRLTNKMKRGVQPLGLRSRSTMERTESQVRKQHQDSKKQQQQDKTSSSEDQQQKQQSSSSRADDQSVDGGRNAHRNIVQQVRARSALLRQRAMSRTESIRANNRLNSATGMSNLNQIAMEEDDMVSEPDDERVIRPDVLLRYKTAGRITDEALKEIMRNIAPGESVFRLCNLGDEYIETKTSKTFTKAKTEDGEPIKRGVAFPTNISVNNVLCYFRPLSEDTDVILKEGDVVKIHCGAQLDGYSATGAHTVVCSSGVHAGSQEGGVQVDADGANFKEQETKNITKETANAIACANKCMTALIRNMRLGAQGEELTDMIKSFASNYGVEACEGVLSNRTKRWILDGSSCIINRRVVGENPFQDVENVEIEPNQVWTLDVAFTTAAAYRLLPQEATIYRRNELPTPNDMRIRAAERLLHEIRDRFLCYPFCPAQSEHGTNSGRLGVSQLMKAGVIDPVSAMRSKANTITVRASCTIAITEKRIHILSGAPIMDSVAALLADEIAPSLVELTQKPLSFVAGGKAGDDDDEANNNQDGGEARSKRAVSAAMKQVGESGMTKNMTPKQLASLYPPGSKRGKAAAAKASESAGAARGSSSGRRDMKERRVEQD